MRHVGGAMSKLISCVVSLCLLCGSLTVPVSAAGQPEPPPPGAVEVIKQRTARSMTFDNGDGTFTHEAYADPINYRDPATGLYVPIDSSLDEVDGADGRTWHNRANAFDVSLPMRTAGNRWVTIETSRAAVSMRAIGKGRGAVLKSPDSAGRRVVGRADAVTYPQALEDADIELESNSNGLKEAIVLPKWNGRTSFSYALRTRGLAPRLDEDGWIGYYERDSADPVFVTPIPVMSDSRTGPTGPAESENAHYELTPSGKDWRLTVVADAAWLADPARIYPVRIDPSVYYWDGSWGLYETYVSKSKPTTNLGTSTILRVGDWSIESMGICYALVKPPLDDFMKGALSGSYDVIDAKLKMWCYGTYTGKSVTNNLARVNASWSQTGVTWNTRPSTTFVSQCSISPNGWTSIDVESIVDRWVSGDSPMYGIMLYADKTTNSCKFYPTESSSSAKPSITVRYTLRPKVTLIDPGPDVAVAGPPNIRWDFVDPEGKALTKAEFEIKQAAPGTANWVSGTVALGPKQNSYQLADGALALQSGRYYVRMRAAATVPGAHDGWSLWTDWRPFDYAPLTSGSDGRGQLAYHASDDLGGGARVDLATGQLQISRTDFAGPGLGGSLGFGLRYDSSTTGDFGFGTGWQLALPSMTPGAQVLANSGFESGPSATGDPTDWYASDTAKADRDTTQARTGASLKLFSATAYASVSVADASSGAAARFTVPGQRYDVSYWVNTSAMTVDAAKSDRGVRAKMVWYDDNGAEVGSSAAENVEEKTTSWVRRTLSCTAPAKAARARLLFEFLSAKGTAWVDDVSLEDGSQVLTSSSGTTRTLRQAGYGQYTRDPLGAGLSLELKNAAEDADVSTNATVTADTIQGASVDGAFVGAASGYDRCSANSSGTNYLQYDLARPRLIDRARIYLWDRAGNVARTYTYFLQTNETGDPADWKDAGSSLTTPKVGSGWQTVAFKPVRTKAVRVYALGSASNTGNTFDVCEFELPVFTLNDAPVFFNEGGQLIATADESDNPVSYLRPDGFWRLGGVEESARRGLDIVWGTSSGRAERLDWRGVDSNGVAAAEQGVVRYTYDDVGRTVTVSRPGPSSAVAVATFGYDASGRITRTTDADGQVATIEYVSGKVFRVVRGPAGMRVTTSYSYGGTADAPVVTVATTGEDGAMLTTTVTLSAALGYQQTEVVSDPAGAAIRTTYGYDSYGHVDSVTTPAGTDTMDLDSHGAVWKTNEKGLRETTAEYADDRQSSATDALGNKTTSTYDECGRLVDSSVRVSADGTETVYTAAGDYDEWGNRVMDGSGGSSGLNKMLNTTFEVNPTTDGWTGGNSGYTWTPTSSLPFSQPYLGSRVVVLAGTPTAGARLVSDSRGLTAEATYTASAWVSGNGRLCLDAYDSTGAMISETPVARSASGGLTSTASMRRITGAWVAPTNGAGVRVHLAVDAGCTAVFDNVCLARGNASSDENLLDNASFEWGSKSAPTNWTASAATGVTQERIEMSSITGSWAAHLKASSTTSAYLVSDWVPVKTGERYTFGGYLALCGYKTSSGGPAIVLDQADASKAVLPVHPQATPTGLRGNVSWRRYTSAYTVPPGVEFVRIQIKASKVTGDVFFDALFLSPAVTQTRHEFDLATHSFEIKTTTNTGRLLTSSFDARGRQLLSKFRASSDSTSETVLSSRAYDPAGRLSGVAINTGTANISAGYTYTAAGRMTSAANPLGRVTRVGYDAGGRVTSVTLPSGLFSKRAYDSLGRLKATYRPGSSSARLAQNAYDSVGRPNSTTYFNAAGTTATVVSTRYDAASRVADVTLTGETSGTVTNTYDALSRITATSMSGPAGATSIATTYDAGDRAVAASWTAFGETGSTTAAFAPSGEVLTKSAFGREYRLGWNASQGLESVLSAFTATGSGRDAFGRTTSVRTAYLASNSLFAPYASYELAYDELDRLTGITAPELSRSEAFGYDLADRLTSWLRDGFTTSYEYDLSGNVTRILASSGASSFSYDVDDRLTSSTAGPVVTAYGNDSLGRRISERPSTSTKTTTYSYDSMGGLVGYESASAGARYAYGATGMRELKVVKQGSATTTTSALWAGGTLVAEKDEDGTLLRYLYGPDGRPLSVQVTRGGVAVTYHYLTDALGSVAALVSETGVIVASYAYDPWGRITSLGGADPWLASRQPLRYRGYYYDTESGLYYLPARYYDPKTCRFLSPDPATPTAGNPLSLNKYVYCEDSPIDSSDPSGAVAVFGGGGGSGSVSIPLVALAIRSAAATKYWSSYVKVRAARSSWVPQFPTHPSIVIDFSNEPGKIQLGIAWGPFGGGLILDSETGLFRYGSVSTDAAGALRAARGGLGKGPVPLPGPVFMFTGPLMNYSPTQEGVSESIKASVPLPGMPSVGVGVSSSLDGRDQLIGICPAGRGPDRDEQDKHRRIPRALHRHHRRRRTLLVLQQRCLGGSFARPVRFPIVSWRTRDENRDRSSGRR